MKVDAGFKVDVDVLKNFLDALKTRNEFPNDVIESFMKVYSEETTQTVITDPPPRPEEGIYYTEKLLENCKVYKVGELAKVVLRKLLEEGVASEDEIKEMQKAAGMVQVKNFHTIHGLYNKENFKTAFPVLITEQQKREYDKAPQKFLVQPLNIYGKNFHLSAQWFGFNREPMENWIRSHLPKWFESATEEQKSNMIKFIESR